MIGLTLDKTVNCSEMCLPYSDPCCVYVPLEAISVATRVSKSESFGKMWYLFILQVGIHINYLTPFLMDVLQMMYRTESRGEYRMPFICCVTLNK